MALVLHRRDGERLRLRFQANDGTVTDAWVAVERDGGQTRLIVEAPNEVKIDREELIRRIER